MEYELLLFINSLGVLTVVGIILYHFIGKFCLGFGGLIGFR